MLAAEAVQTLKQAVDAGWTDAQRTNRDNDLASLRHREDFRRLVATLFDSSFPADPFRGELAKMTLHSGLSHFASPVALGTWHRSARHDGA